MSSSNRNKHQNPKRAARNSYEQRKGNARFFSKTTREQPRAFESAKVQMGRLVKNQNEQQRAFSNKMAALERKSLGLNVSSRKVNISHANTYHLHHCMHKLICKILSAVFLQRHGKHHIDVFPGICFSPGNDAFILRSQRWKAVRPTENDLPQLH